MRRFEVLKLIVPVEEGPERPLYPQEIRKICMGLVPDGDPAWEHVANHAHRYPRVHYRFAVRGDRIEVFGVGEGVSAVKEIGRAIEARRDSIYVPAPREEGSGLAWTRPLRLGEATFEWSEISVGPSSLLHAYTLSSPLFLFDRFEDQEKRSGDLSADYSAALTNNICWILRRLGFSRDEVEGVVATVEAPVAGDRRLKTERPKRGALVRARIVTNCLLPPAVGHGVSYGWGMLSRTRVQ